MSDGSQVRRHNREAWNRKVADGVSFTRPVDSAAVAAARRGEWRIFLTPTRPVPRAWFGDLAGRDVLCLASGGGQQGPILAAAGAQVTVFDDSPKQLEQDRMVAQRDGLAIETVEGDMADLSAFADGSFDLIVHPVSNVFVPAVAPVWREAFRVLRPGGSLLSGFDNPVLHMFDGEAYERGELIVRYRLPYSDVASLPPEHLRRRMQRGEALEFGHTLEDQVGGQIDAGFVITGFYEDGNPPEAQDPLDRYMPVYIVTRALKPEASD